MQVKYSYLDQQFADVESYFADLRRLVASGEFTLGPFVEEFEQKFARYIGVKHAVGTNTGTDALILALKAVGVRPGDEVITVPNSFIATTGAVVAAGARPVFVDCDDRYQIDATRIEPAITPRTKAILPVHWAGCPCDIEAILKIGDRYRIPVVEDACPAVGAKVNGRSVGSFGRVNAFSMHPLKPLNVWGDGGVVVTDDDEAARFLRLYRNHGLVDRDHVEMWGVNNRLQPVQAVVATRLLGGIEQLVEARIRNARLLDAGLADLKEFIRPPQRPAGYREVYQLYLASASRRDELLAYLQTHGIEARVHYPIPLHLQKAADGLGYQRGDFPVCERQVGEIITLPAHQHVTPEQIEYMVKTTRAFYRGR
ncbi:MAG TPA: DegT/DnrJ/EryC1/StrS family aminotransferase [Nitrospiraceae bacterium]|jgi:dTDP-4-amino-4,6-dideoxygalactose transaminase|nr:DegT/DnrJ/EryC1/StrS family aminotransferase [Nitrospiraceae bacterium]